MDFFSYQVTGVAINICADGERISMERGERRKKKRERKRRENRGSSRKINQNILFGFHSSIYIEINSSWE